MPHTLDAQDLALRALFRDFARRQVLPGAAARDASGAYPAELMRELAALDAMGITVPTEFGGLGLPTTSQLLAIEEIAYADAALASIYTAHLLALDVLVLYGDAAQRAGALTRLARGEVVGAFALTEPDAGSDIGAMTTTAARRGDGWELSGTKTFISNAREAGVLMVFAKSEPAAGFRGISAFAVPGDAAGLSFSPPQDKCGIRSAPTYTVYLDRVALPAAALVGAPGRGGKMALTVLNRARIDVAAMANGIAMRALDLALRFASQRQAFGSQIRGFQAIQVMLGEMDAQLEAARLTAHWAATLRDQGADVRRAGAIAKYLASEACFAVVDKAIQIHGGAGFMRESEVERLYRDSRILRIFEGTSQIQLLTIAGALVDRFDAEGALA